MTQPSSPPPTPAAPSPLLATCSFGEYRPDTMGGRPVRISNGSPRYRLAYPLPAEHTLKLLYPARHLVAAAHQGMPHDEFRDSYLAHLDAVGVGQIRAAIATMRDTVALPADQRMVLLCFERMSKGPDEWCHRRMFAAWWAKRTGEEVPEFGTRWIPETRAQEQQLF
jgi:hypothetical protein